MSGIKSILDYAAYFAILGLSIVLYLVWTPLAGILTLVGGSCVVLGLVYITTPGRMAEFKYRWLAKPLAKVRLAEEDEIVKVTGRPPEKVHRGLYELAKRWAYSPLVILVKREYIYVSHLVIKEINREIDADAVRSSESRSQFISKVSQHYGFKTRARAEAVVSRILEKRENAQK